MPKKHKPGQQELPTKRAPSAFISYSWDSTEHKNWVIALATRLREGGVDVMLDKWNLHLGADKVHFMEGALRDSDHVLLICTPGFKEKADRRKGGVGWECSIVTGDLADDLAQTKFVPVLRHGNFQSSLPVWLKNRMGVDLSGNPYREDQFQLLLRDLHGAGDAPPPLGRTPVFGHGNAAPDTSWTGAVQGELSPRAQVISEAPRIFIANRIGGTFTRIFEEVLQPIFRQMKLTYQTIDDFESQALNANLAEAIEGAALQAEVIIWNFDSEAAWIPVFLETRPQPSKSVIVISSRGLVVPEMLRYAQVVRYKTGNGVSFANFRTELTGILSEALSPTQFEEARKLFRLGHYDAALITASNYLIELLRGLAVKSLGYRYFRERPLRYYPLSDLFKVMLEKGKLQIPSEVDWHRLAELRNGTVYRNLVSPIDKELCEWYIGAVERIRDLN